MQIVIDIDENIFTRLFDNGVEDYEISNDDLSAIAKSIRKGILLPKGHSDLIDRNELFKVMRGRESCSKVLMAQTIVEADKESEDLIWQI